MGSQSETAWWLNNNKGTTWFFLWIPSFSSTICWKAVFSSLNGLYSLLENRLTIYFWTVDWFAFNPLVLSCLWVHGHQFLQRTDLLSFHGLLSVVKGLAQGKRIWGIFLLLNTFSLSQFSYDFKGAKVLLPKPSWGCQSSWLLLVGFPISCRLWV